VQLSDLIARFRTLSGDHAQPPLWDDPTVTAWLNEAQREACMRAHLIEDDSTSAIVNITAVNGQWEYPLDPRVQDVLRVTACHTLVGPPYSYKHVVRGYEEDIRHQWARDPDATRRPRHFAVFGDGGASTGRTLILDGIPDQTLDPIQFQLVVDRFPLEDMDSTEPTDTPEISPRHHPDLVQWALHLAYQTRDMEGSAPERSTAALANFESKFGVRPDANVQRKRLRHKATVCQPIGGDAGYGRRYSGRW